MNMKRMFKIYLGIFPDEEFNCNTCIWDGGRGCYNEKMIKIYGDMSRPGQEPVTIPRGNETSEGCKRYRTKTETVS